MSKFRVALCFWVCLPIAPCCSVARADLGNCIVLRTESSDLDGVVFRKISQSICDAYRASVDSDGDFVLLLDLDIHKDMAKSNGSYVIHRIRLVITDSWTLHGYKISARDVDGIRSGTDEVISAFKAGDIDRLSSGYRDGAVAMWNARIPLPKQIVPSDRVIGFPQLRPIPTADPSIRTELDVAVPEDVAIDVENGACRIDFGKVTSRTARITVGKDMLLGWERKMFVVPRGAIVTDRDQPVSIGLGCSLSGTYDLRGGRDWNPVDGGKYSVIIRFSLFETDIPPQHEWNPRAGNFKTVWTRDVVKELPNKP